MILKIYTKILIDVFVTELIRTVHWKLSVAGSSNEAWKEFFSLKRFLLKEKNHLLYTTSVEVIPEQELSYGFLTYSGFELFHL